MTQEERLLQRIKSLDPSSLYEIVIYICPDKSIGFWIVEKRAAKIEGEQKRAPLQSSTETIAVKTLA